jgi:hypothetical protein
MAWESYMIRSYLDDAGTFGPEAIDAMSRAFSDACNALNMFAGATHGREVIAAGVIELARRGLTDPAALRDQVLSEACIAA